MGAAAALTHLEAQLLGYEAIPHGVVSGLDAARHFASGTGRPGESLFCNRAGHGGKHDEADEQGTAGGSNSSEDGLGSVYDLVVVPQTSADLKLHYVVCYSGVIEMR